MKVFASWSGGKDCMFAVYKELLKQEHEIECLLNMCESDGLASRSHGLTTDLIKAQAQAMNIPLVQQSIGEAGYRPSYVKIIETLKTQGVTGGIFGDIFLQSHREWLEDLCQEVGITPIFPLWKEPTAPLLKSFINTGFKALTVAINQEKMTDEWLNRTLDLAFYNDIVKLDGIDPCAEQGEYHTFVYDGPIFKHSVTIETTEFFEKGKNKHIKIVLK